MITVTIHYFGTCGPDQGRPTVRRFKNPDRALAFALAEEAKVSVRRVDVEPPA